MKQAKTVTVKQKYVEVISSQFGARSGIMSTAEAVIAKAKPNG